METILVALAIVAIVVVAGYYYFRTPAPVVPTATDAVTGAAVPVGQFQWDPSTTSTSVPSEAVIAGSAAGVPLYIAAVNTATGWRFAKSNGTTAWYADGDKEVSVPMSTVAMLPYSAVPTAKWSSALTVGGIALANTPTQYFCRAAMANGVHPGVYDGSACRTTYGGKVLTSTTLEYLVIGA